MGILNVTPDSFYDGGRFVSRDAALARAHEIASEGAAILDVGAQSYAASNEPVDEEEELRRLVPIVEALAGERLPLALSVDTFRSRVAREVLVRGADLINDCSGMSDAALPAVVAEFDAALVVMHIKGRLNVREPALYVYDDPLAEIVAFLRERIARACQAGVAEESIVVDPGLEFGKEPETDLEILRRLGELVALGYPVLLAASRKNFLSRLTGRDTEDLLGPSLAAAALGREAGARIFRVHDVKETAALFAVSSRTCQSP